MEVCNLSGLWTRAARMALGIILADPADQLGKKENKSLIASVTIGGAHQPAKMVRRFPIA
jgi:hypothetical protein